MKLTIQELMAESGVKFGTSGARGLADGMTDRVCYALTRGFLQHLEAAGDLAKAGPAVAVAGDLRPSTDRIMGAVFRAVHDFGGTPINSGKVPSPAVALLGLERGIPTVMVTGSHIPDDRNGIKFNKTAGEILKDDEAGMLCQEVDLDDGLFDAQGTFRSRALPPPVDVAAGAGYVRRYLDAFAGEPLRGLRVGVYQHSAVGRDLLVTILRGLGADVVGLERSHVFIPVDTEAIRTEDVVLAREWAVKGGFDAIVSTDGDSDRPLISDERGEWLRGDVAGILCARFLEADSVTTPVSSNTSVERCGWFAEVRRTRIGSPHVIATMIEASASGRRRVVGYEANGGFLIQSDLTIEGRRLRALPTRDALIVIASLLSMARREGRSLAQLVAMLPARFTASDRLERFPIERSREILVRLAGGDPSRTLEAFSAVFGGWVGGRAVAVDRTDGVRVTFERGEILHLRPSGNAPEFRCYAEADQAARATELCARALEVLQQLPWR